MSHERHPTLHGSDIGVGIGVRDIFDPHVGRVPGIFIRTVEFRTTSIAR